LKFVETPKRAYMARTTISVDERTFEQLMNWQRLRIRQKPSTKPSHPLSGKSGWMRFKKAQRQADMPTNEALEAGEPERPSN